MSKIVCASPEKLSVIAGALLYAAASASVDAPPAVDVINPGRQLLEQTARPTPAPAPRMAPKAEQRIGVSNPNEPKFLIRKIEILGATKLCKQEIRKIVARYENRFLGGSDINVLLEALTRAYVNKGYITTRIYLPKQNIKTGVLRLQVLEGRLASFSTSTVSRSQLFTAFPTQPGAIVRLPDLEQGMDHLERPASMRVKGEILPGSSEGASIVALDAARTFPGHLSGGVDNLGTEVIGEWRWLAQGGWDNLLRLNDVWNASYQHSDHSDAVAGIVVLPFRWWTFELLGKLCPVPGTVNSGPPFDQPRHVDFRTARAGLVS